MKGKRSILNIVFKRRIKMEEHHILIRRNCLLDDVDHRRKEGWTRGWRPRKKKTARC